MKKSKVTISIILGLICIILVAVMCAQFKTVEETNITGIETAREEELQTMLSNWKTKYEEIEEKLVETDSKIEEYKKKIESNDQTSELLEEELEQTNLLVGRTDITGQGVIITLKDNDEKSIEASDLRTLVNELKLAGAEAISINDNRILNMTEIVEVNGVILINTDRTVSPFVVKVIGNQTYLTSALNLKNSGFIDTCKKIGKTVELSKENKVKISAYNNRKNLLQQRYAKEVEE